MTGLRFRRLLRRGRGCELWSAERKGRRLLVKWAPGATDAEYRRLSREAACAGAEPTPVIARAWHVEANQHGAFVAYEATDAPTLLQALQRSTLPRRQLEGVALDLFENLSRLHGYGLHLPDLEPEDVIFAGRALFRYCGVFSGPSAVDPWRADVSILATMLLRLAGPGATALEEALRAAADGRVASAGEALRRLGAAPVAPVPRLLGREQERKVLWQAWSETTGRGQARAVCISGDAGTGKTALLHWFADQLAGAGATVLRVSASPGRKSAFGVPREVIRRLIAREGGEDVRGDGLWRRIGAAKERYPSGASVLWPGGEHSGEQRLAEDWGGSRSVGEQAASFAAAAIRSAGALVLILDDLHHADPGTVRFLGPFMRQLGDTPVLIVSAVRGTPRARRMLERWRRDTPATSWRELRLGALDAPTKRAIFEASLGTAHVEDELYDTLSKVAGGTPLAITEITRAALRRGAIVPTFGSGWRFDRDAWGSFQLPGGVRDLFTRAIAELNDDERRVLEVAALLEDATTPERVARVTGLSLEDVETALERAHSVGLYSGQAPVHGSATELLLSNMSAERAGQVHDAIALELLGSADPETVARHFANGSGRTPGKQRFSALLEGAELADQRGDRSLAVSLFEAAADDAVRIGTVLPGDAQLRHATAELSMGNVDRAADLFESLRASVQDPYLRASAASGLVTVSETRYAPREAIAWALEGLRELGEILPRPSAAAAIGSALRMALAGVPRRVAARRNVEEGADPRGDLIVRLYYQLGRAGSESNQPEVLLMVIERMARRVVQRPVSTVAWCLAAAYVAFWMFLVRRPGAARRFLDLAEAQARAHGTRDVLGTVLSIGSALLPYLDDMHGARARAFEVAHELGPWQSAATYQDACMNLDVFDHAMGRINDADSALARLISENDAAGDAMEPVQRKMAELVMMRAAWRKLDLGRPEDAKGFLRKVAEGVRMGTHATGRVPLLAPRFACAEAGITDETVADVEADYVALDIKPRSAHALVWEFYFISARHHARKLILEDRKGSESGAATGLRTALKRLRQIPAGGRLVKLHILAAEAVWRWGAGEPWKARAADAEALAHELGAYGVLVELQLFRAEAARSSGRGSGERYAQIGHSVAEECGMYSTAALLRERFPELVRVAPRTLPTQPATVAGNGWQVIGRHLEALLSEAGYIDEGQRSALLAQELQRSSGAERLAILMVHDDGRSEVLATAGGPFLEEDEGYNVSVVRECAERREPVMDRDPGGHIRSLAVPMLSEGRVIGAVSADAPSARSRIAEHQADVLQAMVEHLPVVLRLVERLRREAAQKAALEGEVRERSTEARTLREQVERKERIIEAAYDPLVVLDTRSLRVEDVNERACELFGLPRPRLQGLHLALLFQPGEHARVARWLSQAADAAPQPTEFQARDADGRPLPVELVARPSDFADPSSLVLVIRDIRQRKRVMQELQQAQKMEALGRLAGGVAHDFNNMLAVIRTSVDSALESEQALEEQLAEELTNVRDTAVRAGNLTKRLLAFARRGHGEPPAIDLGVVARGLTPMLRRMVPAGVEFVPRIGEQEFPVRIDATEAEQVMTNLVVNAGEAMADGGTVVMRLAPVRFEEGEAPAGLGAGTFLSLTVSDTGAGMTEDERQRMFDPFFTTKAQGTGLGLAVVYGAVHGHKGGLEVDSAHGRGTRVTAYFPLADAIESRRGAALSEVEQFSAEGKRVAEPTAEVPTGPELYGDEGPLVMLVDDESVLRTSLARALAQRGYRVCACSNGHDAIEYVRAHREAPVDLLITDVQMPRMSGPQLVRSVQELQPGIRALFVTGFADGSARDSPPAGAEVLVKPFALSEFAARVAELVGARAPSTWGTPPRAQA